MHPFDCGHFILGNVTNNKIQEIKENLTILFTQRHINKFTMLSCTVLNNQNVVRELLRSYGFKKTKEVPNKYKEHTICIYYYNEPYKENKNGN